MCNLKQLWSHVEVWPFVDDAFLNIHTSIGHRSNQQSNKNRITFQRCDKIRSKYHVPQASTVGWIYWHFTTFIYFAPVSFIITSHVYLVLSNNSQNEIYSCHTLCINLYIDISIILFDFFKFRQICIRYCPFYSVIPTSSSSFF